MTKSVNIINFIRGVEPRYEFDLLEPVIEQMKLAKHHHLPVTWLMQYDALIAPIFTEYLKANMDFEHEIGAWFEVVQPMAEAAGIPWRGRYPWDCHVDKGFSVGYTPEQREQLADVFMGKFLEVWGIYPDSVGSWFMDAHLLEYLYRKYNIKASCNCKDQWGTDGYTLWGGYWANAYYPSRFNSYMPAQTIVNQIPVPVFRMLGSDPIYQYNGQVGNNGQCVITLEPAYSGDEKWKYGGGDPVWTRWFFDTTFNNPDLSMSYAQVGQENSFGWQSMKEGIIDQFALIAEWAIQGQFQVETLRTSAQRFRNDYQLTPATAVIALDDWQKQNRASVWYLSRYQRLNFFVDNDQLHIRDWHCFDENYKETFLENACASSKCMYDTLPIMDGLLWKYGKETARINFRKMDSDGQISILLGKIKKVNEVNKQTLALIWQCEDGNITITANETELIINFGKVNAVLEYCFQEDKTKNTIQKLAGKKQVYFEHNSFKYNLDCNCGNITKTDESILFTPEKNILKLSINTQVQ